jgi:hypothetical protein
LIHGSLEAKRLYFGKTVVAHSNFRLNGVGTFADFADFFRYANHMTCKEKYVGTGWAPENALPSTVQLDYPDCAGSRGDPAFGGRDSGPENKSIVKTRYLAASYGEVCEIGVNWRLTFRADASTFKRAVQRCLETPI